MIQRIFHPIGQGAFYSERHKGFNIVYDCGNWKNTKIAGKLVQGSFEENEIIDILFISHFDADHVNKIPDLISNFVIKKVVVPLLHNEEKIVLSNFYRVLGQPDLVNLVDDPQNFFGEETLIIFVNHYEDMENKYNNNELNNKKDNTIELDNVIVSKTIQSGSKLMIQDWVYIPYNFDISTRVSELEKSFVKLGLDFLKFKNDINYQITHRKKIKDAYKQVKGDINRNSMVVYSGPETDSDFYLSGQFCRMNSIDCRRSCYWCYSNLPQKVGCIYTGDFDLNTVNLMDVYKEYWDLVGTIQIPHHGDLNSFDSGLLINGFYICPISVGSTNSYGHPSNKVIIEILKQSSNPYLITEKTDSLLIQTIRRY